MVLSKGFVLIAIIDDWCDDDCSCLLNFDKNGIPRPQYKPTETHENSRGKMATFFNPKNLTSVESVKVSAGGFRPQNVVFMSGETLLHYLIKCLKNLIPSNSWWRFGWLLSSSLLTQSRNPTRHCSETKMAKRSRSLHPQQGLFTTYLSATEFHD
jgi:hypothetical protein